MHFSHFILKTEATKTPLNSLDISLRSCTHYLYRILIILLRPDKLITVNCELYNIIGVYDPAQSVIELKRFRISYALCLPPSNTFSLALTLCRSLSLSFPGAGAQKLLTFFYDTPLRGSFNVLNIITWCTQWREGSGGVEQGRRTISALHTN